MKGTRFLLLAACAAGALPAHAVQLSPVGFWITRNEGAVVEILPCESGSGMCGRLVGLSLKRPAGDPPPRDTHNPDAARRSDPICGISLMGSLSPVAGPDGTIMKWQDGWVYDPTSGDTYSAQMWMDGPDSLKLRGYLGISLFGRSETWTREGEFKNRCTPPSADSEQPTN